MDRKEFLSTFGFSLAAVCAGTCLASCEKQKDTPPPVSPPVGTVVASVNLATEITTIGSAVVKNGVIIVRLQSGQTTASFTAVQVACTHVGTDINYVASQGEFVCPAHGSKFNNNGIVTNGPASSNLKKYSLSITGNTLNVLA